MTKNQAVTFSQGKKDGSSNRLATARSLAHPPDSDAPVHRRHARRGGWRPRRKPRDFCTPRASTVRVSAVLARVGRAFAGSRWRVTASRLRVFGSRHRPIRDRRRQARHRALRRNGRHRSTSWSRDRRDAFRARVSHARAAPTTRARVSRPASSPTRSPHALPLPPQTWRRSARRASPTSGTWRTRSPAPPRACSWRWHPWAARPTSPRAPSASRPRRARPGPGHPQDDRRGARREGAPARGARRAPHRRAPRKARSRYAVRGGVPHGHRDEAGEGDGNDVLRRRRGPDRIHRHPVASPTRRRRRSPRRRRRRRRPRPHPRPRPRLRPRLLPRPRPSPRRPSRRRRRRRRRGPRRRRRRRRRRPPPPRRPSPRRSSR